jgi:glycosyltransferase involved in cell wall biosynthesis
MEGSTTFTVADRTAARRHTGMDGSPVFLWVGRLDANKDPLTVLAGLEPVLRELPGARLHMAHGPDSPLLEAVRARIAESEVLCRAVHLLGTVPHSEMEAVFNSADYFVLGSRFEGSGFALAEALACGVVPIVTDIPSFHRMTDGGAVGALWSSGRPEAMTAAVREAVRAPLEESSATARAVFDARSSFAAIGRDALAAYRKTYQRLASDQGGGRVGRSSGSV